MGEHLYLERFFWFDRKIRNQRFPNASSLADHFEISSKTAQRNINQFRYTYQAPLEYVHIKKGYTYSDKNFLLPTMRISEDELLALLIAKKLISEASAGFLALDLKRVSGKLGSLLQENVLGHTRPEEAFSFRWRNFNPTNAYIFKPTAAALMNCNLLTFSYKSIERDRPGYRTVEPHHMANYMGNWHLIAFCHLRNGWRDFVLGRMSDCYRESTSFSPRPKEEWHPSLVDTFGIFQTKKHFEVTLRFTPQRSRWVKNEIWHEKQVQDIDEHGFLTLILPASHKAEIMMEILKHGSEVEVLKPEWLRKEIAQELSAAMKTYTA